VVNFTSNSFSRDNIGGGLEYSFKNQFIIRGGGIYEKDILNSKLRGNVFLGPSGGFSAILPLNNEKETSVGLDYSFRATNPFKGVHTIGLRIIL
jgi:hypothetical protein